METTTKKKTIRCVCYMFFFSVKLLVLVLFLFLWYQVCFHPVICLFGAFQPIIHFDVNICMEKSFIYPFGCFTSLFSKTIALQMHVDDLIVTDSYTLPIIYYFQRIITEYRQHYHSFLLVFILKTKLFLQLQKLFLVRQSDIYFFFLVHF